MRYLVLGGTGTLGSHIVARLLQDPSSEVTIFSRDEFKQKELMKYIKSDMLKGIIGDIRDRTALNSAMHNIDVVFHVAALKHIDVMEDNPDECIKTNILGTLNVADAAINHKIPHVIFSSTDKAVLPINTYGMSKAISEKILQNKNRIQSYTKFSIFRWGNVLGSRGSVIPEFVRTLKQEKKVYLTDSQMTRFWIKIDEAVKFMLNNYKVTGDIKIPVIKGASICRIIATLAELLKIQVYRIEQIGLRKGEKLHESLTLDLHSNTVEQFTDEELEALLKDFV